MNLTKIQSHQRNPLEIFFLDVTFEKYEDYAKTKSLLEIMAEYLKVLGSIKQQTIAVKNIKYSLKF
jgi:prephenate dehydratase